MEDRKPFFKIIDEICKEKNIEQKEISYGWIKNLSKNGISCNIIGNQLDLNSAVSYNIAGDKYATYEILNSNNIPIIPHEMFFNPETRSRYYEKNFIKNAENIFEKYNNKIVIKANNSCEGKDVYFCNKKEDISKIIMKLFNGKHDSLSVCPYFDIDYEYRVIYLCEEIIYVYKKRKPFVVGDGTSNLRELIESKNKENSNITIDIIKDLNLNYIPKKGEEVNISWKHNLANGAIPIIIDDSDKYIEEVKSIALRAGQAINIKFSSVDIALTSDKKLAVMEVNRSVCMNKFSELVPNGYEIAKNIYAKAIDKMFEI